MKKTLFVNAGKSYNWEDDYDEAFPYTLNVSSYEAHNSSSWTVGTIDVVIPVPTRDHIVSCQVHGLEATITELAATYYTAKENLEQQLKDLKALPAPAAPLEPADEPEPLDELVEVSNAFDDDVPF